MRTTLRKVVLAVLLAGLLTGGLAIASAATKVRTVTTPQGTTVDVISVTGTVTEVSAPSTATAGTGFMGMFRHQRAGYATIKDSTDGTVYTIELGLAETASLTMKMGDTVTIEGTSTTWNGINELRVWTFTGADGKTVTLCNADGTPNIQTVSVAGTVTAVNLPVSATGTIPPVRRVISTITVKQADGTTVTVVLGHEASAVAVKVGDSVKVEGFKTPMDANTVMATSFTGADGKTVTLRDLDDRGGPHGVLQGEAVTVSGAVTAVNVATTAAPYVQNAITVRQADGTVVTVVLGYDASAVAVKVGDSVKVEGFKTPMDANTVMATSFTGADGKKVTLNAWGFGGRGGHAGEGPRMGRGFRGDSGNTGSASGVLAPSGA